MDPVPREIFTSDEMVLGWITTPANLAFTTLTLRLRQRGAAVMTLGEDHTNARHFTWSVDAVSGNQYDVQVLGMLANGTVATASTNVFSISDPGQQLWCLLVLLIIPCGVLYVCCKRRRRQGIPVAVATPYNAYNDGGDGPYYSCPASVAPPPSTSSGGHTAAAVAVGFLGGVAADEVFHHHHHDTTTTGGHGVFDS